VCPAGWVHEVTQCRGEGGVELCVGEDLRLIIVCGQRDVMLLLKFNQILQREWIFMSCDYHVTVM